MDNMDFNNINNNNDSNNDAYSNNVNNNDSFSYEKQYDSSRQNDAETGKAFDASSGAENTESADPNQINSEPASNLYGENNSFLGPYYEQRNSNINIQNIPVKKNKRLRRAFSYIACTLVAAMLGGVAGGSYVNYIAGKNRAYDTPITASQSGTANIINYSAPTSLISKIAADVGPAVVGVDTEVVTKGFLGQQTVAQGSGSGIIFDKKGYIVTNQHVIDNGKTIMVTLPGKQKFKAQVVGQDQISDIAVLKINADNLNLPVAKFGDSSKVKVGDLAIAIGNPLGEEYAGTVTSGIVSALNRTAQIDEGSYDRRYKLIQTDAAINPGNSGGALINENGEVIGINSIKFTNDGTNSVEGMGFAIPINDVKDIIAQLMKNGYISRPYLGVEVITVTEQIAKEYNCPTGVGVSTVQRGSAAEQAGLKPNDVILEIDGIKLQTNDAFVTELQKHKVGDSVKLKVWREGSTITMPVTLGENKSKTN